MVDFDDFPLIDADDGFDLQRFLGDCSIDSSFFDEIFSSSKNGTDEDDHDLKRIIDSTVSSPNETPNCEPTFPSCNPALTAEYESFAQSILTSSPPTEANKDFTCSICSKSFPDRRYLNRHFNKHTNRFTCPHCQKSFARKESKLKHIPRCRVINPESGKRKKHNQSETPKYSCDECFQQFTRKENYNQHMWAHKGIRVVCPYCQKKFSSMKSFSAHKKLHDYSRIVYFCNHCAAVFLFKSNLKRHLRQYQNVKETIICEKCELRVKNQENLEKHKSQSVKQCVLCSQSFCLAKDLRSHRKALHPELWFKCKLCDPKVCFTARSEHHLQDHAKKAHKTSLKFMNCYEEGWYIRCE